MIKKSLIHYYISFRETGNNIKQSRNFDFATSRLEARIIRYLHIIEKGLSLSSPRHGFGVKKIDQLFKYIDEYIALNSNEKFCLYMACDELDAYLKFHQEYSPWT